MTEVERRKVRVFCGVQTNMTGQKVTIRHTPNGFVLANEAGTDVATSLSDHSLSNWGFNHGVREIEMRYNLILGDDNR